MAELLAVIGQHRVDIVRDGFDEGAQEVGGDVSIGFLFEPDEGQLRGSVDCHEQVELALFGADLGDVDVEVAALSHWENWRTRHDSNV